MKKNRFPGIPSLAAVALALIIAPRFGVCAFPVATELKALPDGTASYRALFGDKDDFGTLAAGPGFDEACASTSPYSCRPDGTVFDMAAYPHADLFHFNENDILNDMGVTGSETYLFANPAGAFGSTTFAQVLSHFSSIKSVTLLVRHAGVGDQYPFHTPGNADGMGTVGLAYIDLASHELYFNAPLTNSAVLETPEQQGQDRAAIRHDVIDVTSFLQQVLAFYRAANGQSIAPALKFQMRGSGVGDDWFVMDYVELTIVGTPVQVASNSNGDAPIPLWALGLLAVALLSVVSRSHRKLIP